MSPVARFRAGAALLCLALGLPPGALPRLGAAESGKPAAVAQPSGAAAATQSLGAAAAAARLKARLSWDPLTASGVLERNGFRVSLALGSATALFDYRETLSLDPPFDPGSGLRFTEASVAALEQRFSKAEEARRSRFSVAAILIDPGHGGKDSGAVGEHSVGGKKIRVVEKELALDLSLRVYKALKARFPERRILLTRSGDSYPTLEERVEMANDVDLADNEAIIYVSIHANASFNKNARGFEVWYLNPEYRRTLVDKDTAKDVGADIAPILNAMLEEEFTTESILLAREIMDGLAAGIGAESPNRGVRAEEWFVVRNARMPSVLVEAGFVTNPEEAALLSTEDYLRRLSEGIYNGVADFVSYFEMKGAPAP